MIFNKYANLKYKTRIPIAQTIGISYLFTFKNRLLWKIN